MWEWSTTLLTVVLTFINSKHQILTLCIADRKYQQVSGDKRGSSVMLYTTLDNFLLKDWHSYLENFSNYKVRPDVITTVSQNKLLSLSLQSLRKVVRCPLSGGTKSGDCRVGLGEFCTHLAQGCPGESRTCRFAPESCHKKFPLQSW